MSTTENCFGLLDLVLKKPNC